MGGRISTMTDMQLLNGKRILIVDDEPDVLETLEDLLSRCVVESASDFESAKRLIETRPFDIAILDIMGVDGYHLLEIAGDKKIMAVMLTAHALSPENIVKSYNKGAAYYVPKEKMSEIATYLADILMAQKKGESTWGKWIERMASYCEKKFGPNWQKDDKSFWDRIPFY